MLIVLISTLPFFPGIENIVFMVEIGGQKTEIGRSVLFNCWVCYYITEIMPLYTIIDMTKLLGPFHRFGASSYILIFIPTN